MNWNWETIARLLQRSDPEAVAALSGAHPDQRRIDAGAPPLMGPLRRGPDYRREAPYPAAHRPNPLYPAEPSREPPMARPLPPDHPGVSASFADWSRALDAAQRPPAPAGLLARDGPPPEPAGRPGFAPPDAPQQPQTPPLQARSSPQAVAAALADMDAQAAGPWTERPQGFLQGIGWELRELLIQREMERQRLEREAERLGRRNGPAR